MEDLKDNMTAHKKYVLVTAAYNEEVYIEKVLRSVVSQSVLPKKWIVVSDGSTDRTDEIVRTYAERYEFIQLHRITERHDRNFAAQVHAINLGFAQLRGMEYDYIGNLDADISLECTYFARLLRRFEMDTHLGLAGGSIYEESHGQFRYRKNNNLRSVAHGVQMFRRECLKALGGYVPLPYGGPDWHAEVTARMNGWRVEAFADLPAFHHRPTGTAAGLLRYWYRQGLMDFSLGSHPLFEVVKVATRVPRRPYVLGAFARLLGFVWAHCSGDRRPVSGEFVQFLRNEQKKRLRYWLRKPHRSCSDTGGAVNSNLNNTPNTEQASI
jgi:glycosyltransferase involved in cell wall biosynthesis